MYRTMTAAARELAIDAKSLRKCLDRAGITLGRHADNRRVKLVSDADMARVREVAAMLWPARSQMSQASGHLDAAGLSALSGRLDALERRVRALETRQHAPALTAAYTPAVPRETPPAPSYVRASLDDTTGEMFPLTARARGRWVAARAGGNGPSSHTVRDWQETSTWQSAADAIRDVRARGWPDFMRSATETDTPESRTE